MIEDENLLLKYRLIYGYDYQTIGNKMGKTFRGNVSKQIKEILEQRGLADLNFKLKTGKKPKKNIKNRPKPMFKKVENIPPMEPTNDEDKLILELRKEAGLSLESIAEQLGRDRQTITRRLKKMLRNGRV